MTSFARPTGGAETNQHATTRKEVGKSPTVIEYVEPYIVYDNPKPHVHSRHGYHPGIEQLPDGELIALFVLAEAFEAPNGTTYITRSHNGGSTWHLQGPLYDKSALGVETTDTMKPRLLRDGTLIATGYRFHRRNLEQAIAIPESGGFQPGENVVSFSRDLGRSWSQPKIIERSRPELLENSGACIETASGDLIATAGYYKLPDGSNPSGRIGVVLRSRDHGRNWDDRTLFVTSGQFIPWESRVCEMQPSRLVAIIWAYDDINQRHLSNRVTVSHDNGYTWSPLIDTGHMGQTSALMYLGGEYLVSIHAHRAEDPGIYVRVVDFSGDTWKVMSEAVIWGRAAGQQTREGQQMSQMFTSLRFGQPSIMRLRDGDFLASHWSIEEGQGKIRAHRLRIRMDELSLQ
ncbi:MAG: sialidase family protein [Terriglobales bacterium]